MARVWVAALAAVGVLCVGVAIWLGWWAADLFHQMDVFYRTAAPEQPDEVYLYYDVIGNNSYVMQQLLAPLLAGAVFAVLAICAVTALRWERRNGAAT